ncbi:MAG: outer membrane beta-barrel protein [Chitinophagales bacterium]
MEYLDDEMDDLFRKAGEQYPLRTSDSDWDTVLGRLKSVGGESAPLLMADGNKKNNKRRFFWLLLLLPLGLFSLKYFQGTGGNHLTRPLILNPSSDSKNIKAENAVSDHSASAHTTSPQGMRALAEVMHPQLHTTSGLSSKQDADAGQTVNPGMNLNSNTTPENQKLPEDKPATASASIEAESNSAVSNAGGPDHSGQGEIPKPDVTQSVTVRQPGPAKTDSLNKDKKTAKISSSADKGIYLSVLAGPDLSTIKFQSVKKTGYSIGLLGGYRFNKHLAVEAGIFWDKKQYYSDGKYFNKSKTDIPASYNIQDLEGNCNMFEIPLALRYDFSYNRKGRFFSTAGFSTYLMKKENYSYTVEYGGSAWPHNAAYKNSGNNFLSILQISGGYEYNWGKIGRIRIEPYLKIPLTGVGIGQLAISSAGLHLGITHPFR